MTDKLLPCPFCGSERTAALGPYGSDGLFKVQCLQCCAEIRGFDSCKQDAVDAWNTRYSQGGTQDLRQDGYARCRSIVEEVCVLSKPPARDDQYERAMHEVGTTIVDRINELSSQAGSEASSGVDGEPLPMSDHDEINRKVLNQPWDVQKAIITITAHCTAIRDTYPNLKVADLAACISQCCNELADALVVPAQCVPLASAIKVIKAEPCPFKDGPMADAWAEAWATFLNRLGDVDGTNDLYAASSRTPHGNALARLKEKIHAKLAQVEHYKINECQLDHARAVAEGRIGQINQILIWIDEIDGTASRTVELSREEQRHD